MPQFITYKWLFALSPEIAQVELQLIGWDEANVQLNRTGFEEDNILISPCLFLSLPSKIHNFFLFCDLCFYFKRTFVWSWSYRRSKIEKARKPLSGWGVIAEVQLVNDNKYLLLLNPNPVLCELWVFENAIFFFKTKEEEKKNQSHLIIKKNDVRQHTIWFFFFMRT